MKLINNGTSLDTQLNEKMTIELTKAEYLILFASIGKIEFDESYSDTINDELVARCMPNIQQIFEAASVTCRDVYKALVEIYGETHLSMHVNL